MAIASENSATVVIRASICMIIFCFASCATGSCLSYGHSCWGAHGKRNGEHNNAYLVSSKTMNLMQQGIPLFTKEQLIFSPLIGQLLVSNKHKERWNKLFKIKVNLLEHLDDGDLDAYFFNDESIRNQNNNEDVNESKKKHANDVQNVIEVIDDKKKKIPNVLLIRDNRNDQYENKPQNMEFLKFLSDINGNFK